MKSVAEQVERIRKREVAEGRLYDCPKKYYARILNAGETPKCAGLETGVGGVGISIECKGCEAYLPRNLRNVA